MLHMVGQFAARLAASGLIQTGRASSVRDLWPDVSATRDQESRRSCHLDTSRLAAVLDSMTDAAALAALPTAVGVAATTDTIAETEA